MRLSTAALALIVSTSSVSAFTPTGWTPTSSFVQAPQAFGVSHRRQMNLAPGSRFGLSASVEDDLISNLYLDRNSEVLKSGGEEEVRAARADTQAPLRDSVVSYMKQYEGQTGASIIYSKLLEYGVDVVNGYSGGAVLPLLDQFHVDHPRHALEGASKPIRWITNSNESSAGHIAEGYAKSAPLPLDHDGVTDVPVGVAIATSGPGVTNLITPLQDAICDGVPIVVLCGQAATTAPADAFQFAPAVALTTPCTKWSYAIKTAAELPFAIDYAFYVARHGRPGPVFLDLPKDLQNEIVTEELIQSYTSSIPSIRHEEEFTELENLARIITKKRPNGEEYSVIRMGRPDKALHFTIMEDNQNTLRDHKLTAVTDAEDSSYNLDHHATNLVYKTPKETTVKVNGASAKSYVGKLDQPNAILAELMEMINIAKKPVIVAGQGCNDSAAELKEFAELLQIPVTTTLHALGCFDERHELALNMMGMHGHPTPNFMVQESDLIINIGSRFDDRITGRIGDFIPEARQAAKDGKGGIIHVDIRLTENARQVEPTFFVHATGKNFLRSVLQHFKEDGNLGDRQEQMARWLKRMKRSQKEYPILMPNFKAETVTSISEDNGEEVKLCRTPMSAQSVVSMLDKKILEAGIMDDCLFSTGVGIHQMVAAQLITWTQPRQMLSSGSLGTMGVALGYAVGAQLANGSKVVIAIDGDGSFNMTFTELKTVAEQGIPVKIMILDNESQMMVEYWQRLFHEGRFLAVRNQQNPDYVKLAGAFGIKSLYCDAQEDLEGKIQEFLFDDPGKPVVFHVRIERTPCLPLVAPGQPLQNMILEDIDCEMDASAAPS